MRSNMWKGLVAASIALLGCTLLAINTQATADDNVAVTAPAKGEMTEFVRECLEVSVADLEAMGYGAGTAQAAVDPSVGCLMTADGYMGFQTVAKGKWSALGWCSDEDPNMGPCLQTWPPGLVVCVLPARPTFECVIRDWCTWEDFWAAHQFTLATPPPVIDFDNYAVIAVVLGERDNCGWEVTIRAIQDTDCGVRVHITECLQTGVEDRLINPYHFVKIPKSCIPFGKRICFDHGRGPEPVGTEP